MSNSSKFDGKLIGLKDTIRRSKNGFESVVAVKSSFSIENISTYAKRLAILPELTKFFVGIPFPESIDRLRQTPLQSVSNLEKELYWLASMLGIYAESLNRFVVKKRRV